MTSLMNLRVDMIIKELDYTEFMLIWNCDVQ